jgi:hypothetical protein
MPAIEILTDQEAETVVLTALAAAEPGGGDLAELERVVAWAERAKVDAAALRLVLQSRAGVRSPEAGRLTFSRLGEVA